MSTIHASACRTHAPLRGAYALAFHGHVGTTLAITTITTTTITTRSGWVSVRD